MQILLLLGKKQVTKKFFFQHKVVIFALLSQKIFSSP
jgi:hypothetical protein